MKGINPAKSKLLPCGMRVIFKPYPDNPYKNLETTESGVIFGAESSKRYVSDDSGEMEENETAILCAKVIAVGPDCKYVHEGDDIFVVSYLAQPVPYRHMGYKCIDECNIMCKVEYDGE